MRAAFVRTLMALAAQDPRIMLLAGDLGYMALEPFRDQFPGRFINVGVAEQNMVGVATGLADAGFIPFVYSIAPFAALRPYEFIRNGPIQHQLPVRIVGMGGGFEYGTNGLSHYGLEDLGVMRIQPGITVIAPADHQQAETALRASWHLPGPIYYRLGKDDKTVVPGLDGRFSLDTLECVGEGPHLLMITTGSIASEAAAAAQALAAQGVPGTLLVAATLRPAPCEELAGWLARFAAVMTVEAHYREGGLGSLVAEVIAERGLRCRLVRCGVGAVLDGLSGSQSYLHQKYGLAREALVARALQTVRAQPA